MTGYEKHRKTSSGILESFPKEWRALQGDRWPSTHGQSGQGQAKDRKKTEKE